MKILPYYCSYPSVWTRIAHPPRGKLTTHAAISETFYKYSRTEPEWVEVDILYSHARNASRQAIHTTYISELELIELQHHTIPCYIPKPACLVCSKVLNNKHTSVCSFSQPAQNPKYLYNPTYSKISQASSLSLQILYFHCLNPFAPLRRHRLYLGQLRPCHFPTEPSFSVVQP